MSKQIVLKRSGPPIYIGGRCCRVAPPLKTVRRLVDAHRSRGDICQERRGPPCCERDSIRSLRCAGLSGHILVQGVQYGWIRSTRKFGTRRGVCGDQRSARSAVVIRVFDSRYMPTRWTAITRPPWMPRESRGIKPVRHGARRRFLAYVTS